MSNKFSVYTDGSCLNNGKKNSIGAIGIYFSEDDEDNLGQVIDNEGNKVTNQTMELLACVQALKIIKDKNTNGSKAKIIYVYTDSTYLINCMTKWYTSWEKNGWKNSKGKDVENKELIQLLYGLKTDFIVIFKHVRSHQDPPSNTTSDEYNHWYGNYMADKLATEACKEFVKDKEKEQLEELSNLSAIENGDSEEDKQQVSNAVTKAKSKTTRTNTKKKVKNCLNV
jgi:ribonuclease HI